MYIFPQLPSTILLIPTDIFIGILFMCLLYAINYYGLSAGALLSKILSVLTLVPLTIVTVGPWFAGLIKWEHFQPFLPLNWQTGEMEPSWFTWPAIYGILGGLFIAAWCDYAYECAACYTAEYKNPQKETFQAIGAATALNAFYYILLPITLIGVFPVEFIKEDPYLVYPELGAMLMGDVGRYLMVAMLMATVLLMMNQATNGGARALYQMAEDDHHPKQFAILNKYRIPSVGMFFDICFNAILMFIRIPIVILAASAVGYIIVNVLGNLAVSFMRWKFPKAFRPFKVPKWMFPITASLFIPNAIFMIGAPVFGGLKGTLLGLLISGVILILYHYRKFVQDRPGWKAWGEHLLPSYMISPPKPDGTRMKSSIPDMIGFFSVLTVAILIVVGVSYL
jgi:amino acid transporter